MDIKITPSFEKISKDVIIGNIKRKLTIIKPNISAPRKNSLSQSAETSSLRSNRIKRVIKGCSGCSRKSSRAKKRG